MDYDAQFRELYNKDILLSPAQAYVIAQQICMLDRQCNMLVFGCGNDSLMWHKLNCNGNTMFMETSPQWRDMILSKCPDLNILLYDVGKNTVSHSLNLEIDLLPYPDALAQYSWDIILVDGPEGYGPDKPGRALPIIWTSQIRNEKTHIFVDDYNREVERIYTDKFIGNVCSISDPQRRFEKMTLAWHNPVVNPS